MICGIGVDILRTDRIGDLRGKYDDPFFEKTFTGNELAAGMSRADPIAYFAGRFAAKEAVLKALGAGSDAFRFRDIETLSDDLGKPYVNLYGCMKERFDAIGARRIHISISGDGDYVTAFAICEI